MRAVVGKPRDGARRAMRHTAAMSEGTFEIIAWQDTDVGTLCLRKRRLTRLAEPITEITIDEAMLMSSHLTLSERTLARSGIERCTTAGALRVLVGGLGLGYTAREALAFPAERVAQVEVVELSGAVIGWTERGLIPLSAELSADPRLSIVEGDVYARLLAPPAARYDVILVDVDHSPEHPLSAANLPFYRADGLRRAQAHLAPGGVLGVWSYAEHSPFADALREVFTEVTVEPVTVLNDLIGEEQTDWLFFAR